MAKKRKLQKAPSLRNARNPRSEASGRRKALLSERVRVPARRNARRFLRKLYRGNQRKKAVKKEAKIEAGSGKDREIEKYEVTADGITAGITITENGGEKRYNVKIQDFSFITKALLAEIRNSIVSEVLVSSTEVLDPTALEGLKKKFREKAEQLITEKVPLIKSATTNLLVGRLMQEMLGLDRIEFLLADIDLEEIVLTSVP